MSEPIEAPWRHDLILNEIAGLCLNVARDLSRCAEDTENPERKVKLAGALHQMCRSIRQTLALQARLARHVRREDRKRAEVRKARVRSGLKQLIWTEYEPTETPELEARLERLLDAEPETLAKGSVEAHIQRLSKLLGVRFTTPAPSQRTSSSGLSRGPMYTASQCDPATVPTHPERSADMDPRDKSEGGVQSWGVVTHSMPNDDPATAPTHPAPPAGMDPRDKPAGDVQGWEPAPRGSSQIGELAHRPAHRHREHPPP